MKIQINKDYIMLMIEPADILQIRFDHRGANAPIDSVGEVAITLSTTALSTGDNVMGIYLPEPERLFRDVNTGNIILADAFKGLEEVVVDKMHLEQAKIEPQ